MFLYVCQFTCLASQRAGYLQGLIPCYKIYVVQLFAPDSFADFFHGGILTLLFAFNVEKMTSWFFKKSRRDRLFFIGQH